MLGTIVNFFKKGNRIKMSKKIVLLVPGFLLLLLTGFASASMISGDFRTESDLDFGLGPKVYQDIGATIDSGVELTDADFVENPEDWGGGLVFMDYNPLTNILTLDSQDEWDFMTFDAWINNIIFNTSEVITGISMLSNGLTDPVIVPTLSFTSNSIYIAYDYEPDVFYFTEGIAEFQITTSAGSPVPEPTTIVLFGLGILGLAGVSRRKK